MYGWQMTLSTSSTSKNKKRVEAKQQKTQQVKKNIRKDPPLNPVNKREWGPIKTAETMQQSKLANHVWREIPRIVKP